jgi:hypothetical protein
MMSTHNLTPADLTAVFAVLDDKLGADDPEELGDVLHILEMQGLVRVKVRPDTIIIHLPGRWGDRNQRINRPGPALSP